MISKAVTFQRLGALPPATTLQGLIVGTSLMAGSFAGKAIVQRMSLHTFQNILDLLLLGSGLCLLWAAIG
jgi:uncharacterized membrane protein YfcA